MSDRRAKSFEAIVLLSLPGRVGDVHVCNCPNKLHSCNSLIDTAIHIYIVSLSWSSEAVGDLRLVRGAHMHENSSKFPQKCKRSPIAHPRGSWMGVAVDGCWSGWYLSWSECTRRQRPFLSLPIPCDSARHSSSIHRSRRQRHRTP